MRIREIYSMRSGLLLLILWMACSNLTTSAQDIAVRGKRIHTVSGGVLTDGVVLIRNGKIAAVGSADTLTIPVGVTVLDVAVVTPGLIDAHSVVGLSGQLNQKHDQDQQESGENISPELRALDAFNYNERLVSWLREHGITCIHTGHAPGASVAGTSMIVKTRRAPLSETVVTERAMMIGSLSDAARKKGAGTKAKQVAALRAEFIKAQKYRREQLNDGQKKRPSRDLRMEALTEVLNKKVPFLITAHTERDIATALRLSREFGFRLILDGCSEIYRCADAVKKAEVAVICHPTMMRTSGERKNASMTTPANLDRLGIPFAFQSGYESYVPKTRVVLFEGAVAVAHGLEAASALRHLTLDAARLLSIDERVGSLEVGKDGDLALFDGDPFEYTTHVVGAVIDGHHVSSAKR